MLRDHTILHAPFVVDLSQTKRVPVPDAWKGSLDQDTIEVLPLVTDTARRYPDGWCTYVHEHMQAPELEICCGGINGKTPKAGALWRQGNLFHFGFEQSPAELNELGRTLLVNSIAYISRFTEDRPITETPSPFVAPRKRIFDRDALLRLVNDKSRDLKEYLRIYVSPELYKTLNGLSREDLGKWFQENRGWICANDTGSLMLDEEARTFGVSPADPKFFDRAIEKLRESGDRADLARGLLRRYAPQGPVETGTPEQWAAWQIENRPYLFFSDAGGYRWYLDPLAKVRKIPTEKLRGADRATRPPIEFRVP